jgi:hypothetical protein
MNGYFKFHPVGQGCFYSGRIYQSRRSFNRNTMFNMVYDCGASFDKEYLYQEIDEYKEQLYYNKLDVLFISHLDNDHVNGITRLLDGIECKEIYLPYLSPIDRLYVAIRFLKGVDEDPRGGDAPDYLRFLESPDDYILDNEKFKVGKLIYINGNDENEYNEESPSKIPPIEPNEKSELINQLMDDDSNDNEISEIKSKHNERVLFKKGNGKLFLNLIWDFYLYYNKTARVNENQFKKLISDIYQINVDDQLSKEQLVKILRNTSKINQLKKKFKKKRDTINTSGLLILHKPINYLKGELFRDNIYFPNLIRRFIPRNFNRFTPNWIHRHINNDNSWGVTLLTGDSCLNQINNSAYIQSNIKKILIFQVPHHGSSTGWCGTYLSDLNYKGNTSAVINFGFGNHYGHPKGIVLSDLIDHNLDIFFCTQFEPFEYIFKLRFPRMI